MNADKVSDILILLIGHKNWILVSLSSSTLRSCKTKPQLLMLGCCSRPALKAFIENYHLSFAINPLNAQLNPICQLLALLGVHHFLHFSRIRVKSLTLRLLMSYIYIYMEHLFLMFLDHTQRRTTVGRTPLDE